MPKKKYPKGPTVKDLIKHLEQFDEDLLVGRSGHYGEIRLLDLSDIQERRIDQSGSFPYLVPEGDYWRSNMRKSTPILELPIFDFGPDPD